MARPPPRAGTPGRPPAGSRQAAAQALEAPIHALCCGVDEAGRGPLAGAVFAAAVILDPERPVAGLRDSKTLSALQRERLRGLIVERSLAFSIAQATVEEIDAINILQASLLAMQRAVAGLGVRPHSALIDGTVCPELCVPSTPVVRGDGKITAIAAASILAKTARDAAMREWHVLYPEYGFDQHMGYGTPGHLQSLARYGACPIHRRSFAPVRAALAAEDP